MAICKRNRKNKKPKKLKGVRLYLKSKIINKYDKLINETIERMKDQTMEELWCELDKLKQEMANEFELAGIKLES